MTLLPQNLNVPSENFGDYVGFLAGEKKVGKSSWCSQFPEHLILEMEVGNARHLSCRYVDIPDLQVLVKVIKELEEAPKYAKTLIIDELNIIYELVCNDILKREGSNDLSDLPWARGWQEAARRTEGYMRRLHALAKGVIYTGHTEIKTVKSRTGKEIATMEVRAKKAVNVLLDRYAVWWGCMMFDEDGSRYMQIVGNDFVKASNGFTNHFNYIQHGKIPLGNSPKEGYNNFMKAFNNEPLLPVAKPGKLKVGTNAKIKGLRTS